jgi:hypothetical protein
VIALIALIASHCGSQVFVGGLLRLIVLRSMWRLILGDWAFGCLQIVVVKVLMCFRSSLNGGIGVMKPEHISRQLALDILHRIASLITRACAYHLLKDFPRGFVYSQSFAGTAIVSPRDFGILLCLSPWYRQPEATGSLLALW